MAAVNDRKCHFIRNWSKYTGGGDGGPVQKEMWWIPNERETRWPIG